MAKADVGLIGLAVMGQNLALNIESRGYRIAVYNRTGERTQEFVQRAEGKNVVPAYSIADFVAQLTRPRRIILMVQAGAAVDAVIEQLLPYLDAGDVIMDGGNSYFTDTRRRQAALQEQGILFLGAGISGGEEGALRGPSIMPGGTRKAWELMEPILRQIAAQVDGEPCCAYIGSDGAGHFVKMVHNGIEYGDMQLICEAYFLMREVLRLSAAEMSEVFSSWNKEELQSYLIEITADILRVIDPETGLPLVDVILDTAGHKGTGKWTAQEGLNLGTAIPTIAEAVFARYLSARKDERTTAAEVLAAPDVHRDLQHLGRLTIDDIRAALYAAKICSYAQGFALLQEAAREYHWHLDLGQIALIWRGGCIIRAQFLNHIKDAYAHEPKLQNLLVDPHFRDVIAANQKGWRKTVACAAQLGVPIPGFASALAYYDAYRQARLPANLLQAQRDYFGAHTYQRVDKTGVFHTQWTNR
ncbi:MAG: NADP-dependent phosphogluconate dehydrogenase [Limnochordia bacterium]